MNRLPRDSFVHELHPADRLLGWMLLGLLTLAVLVGTVLLVNIYGGRQPVEPTAIAIQSGVEG